MMGDTLSVAFLAQGQQAETAVASQLAQFISQAHLTLDFALYDFRLSDPSRAIIVNALAERARAGVAIRIVYDADKPAQPPMPLGVDPAPPGTGGFVQGLGYPFRRIGGMKLMHHKYVVRDVASPAAAVWTGSSNFTDDSWTLQDNNLLTLTSQPLAIAYTHDFTELWESGNIANSGDFQPQPADLVYHGTLAQVQVYFSPGSGMLIDQDIAALVRHARQRIRICSMLLTSGTLLNALLDVLHTGDVAVDGVYDATQMETVYEQWQAVPSNHWKIPAMREIVQTARLVGKISTRYTPTTPHDFMHNKAMIVDDLVITGSYNFSRSAEQNAENILFIASPALAATYSGYIDQLRTRYA